MTSSSYSPLPKPVSALVLGGGDVGSAVAHFLHVRGDRVLISERAGSAHARRGMAFTDALFDGRVELEGVVAQHVAGVDGIHACWAQGACIPVATLDENLIVAAIPFDVVIDATMRRETIRSDLRPLAPLAIGLGPGYTPGLNCHVAVETQWGDDMGRALFDQPSAARSGGPRALDGVKHERFVAAPHAGLWRTGCELGRVVERGEVLGELDGARIAAPIAGRVRGISRDGIQVRQGQRILEIDPRQAPEIDGLGERPRAIAAGVLQILQARGTRAGGA